MAWKVMSGSDLAMMPLCFAHARLANGLLLVFPQLINPLSVYCIGYSGASLLVVRKIMK